jgi:iron complex outermembrane recepter protein
MFKRKSVNLAALLALGAIGGPTFAQQAPAQQLERVEVTGSSIKRVDAEGALPVITLTRKDIAKTGATSVRDLVQMLPSMQGFTTTGESVNGGGGGTTTASLRNLGEVYTLVLLNGRRVAPFTTGSTVNLEQLPLAAIERVEVLVDGASALYGADAIAGVVNFITRQNTTAGEADVRYVAPERKGGKQINVSVSKGFGDLERDGFNIFGSFSADKEDRILASEREWSKTGVRPFTGPDGRDLIFFQTSINGDPPNIEVGGGAPNFDFFGIINPVLISSGACGNNPNSFARAGQCRFDYGATVDLVPKTERKNLFLTGQVKLPGGFRGFAEVLATDSTTTAGYAPPAQPLDMAKGSAIYNKYVLPNLASLGVSDADVGYVTYYMRLQDAGQRTDEYRSRGTHLVLGVDGSLGDFDVAATYTSSKTDYSATNAGGYTSRTLMEQLIDSGKWDPWAQGTDASRAAIAPAVLGVKNTDVESKLDVLSLRGSGPVAKLGSRDVMLGGGVDLMKQSYKDTPDPIYQGPNAVSPNVTDFPVGSAQGSLVSDANRRSAGAFGELIVPVTKELELTGALRYDTVGAVKNAYVFNSDASAFTSGTQGNENSKFTYKLALRFQPMKELLLRASMGTGFRSPAMASIVDPLSEFGVIGTQRDCPVASTDPLFVGCRTVPTQYTLYSGGNGLSGKAGLRPETSEQWATGIRWEPNASFTAGLDFWAVRISDAITTVPEDTAFDNFERYRGLFSLTTDAATGRPILTYNQVAVNSAVRFAKGVDWDLTHRMKLGGLGSLTTRFNGTYLKESYFDLGFGGGKESSLSKLGSDDQVAARVQTRIQATLDSGMFSNTLTFNWRPGYADQDYTAGDATVFLRTANGGRGAATGIEGFRVPSYGTLDWQGVVRPMEGLTITVGIKNLLDKEPPFTIKTVAGNQLGVDSRYHDVIGRTFYVQGNYKF